MAADRARRVPALLALILSALIAGALRGDARADSVTTGAPRRVVRERVRGLTQILFVQPTGEATSSVQLLGVAGPIALGDAYEVIDQDGFAAIVHVTQVQRTDDKCPGFFYQRATARVTGAARAINRYQAIAVGPARSANRASRLIPREDHRSAGAPPPGWTASLVWLIDRDGDGKGDLARYLYDCVAGPDAGPGEGKSICVDDYARDGGTWRVLSKTSFSCRAQ